MIPENKPLFLYQMPMSMVTVSTVIFVENSVIVVEEDNMLKMPSGIVRAGSETVQFAAVRTVKEQTGIILPKNSLVLCDIRSDPSRSKEHNVIDVGMICMNDIKDSIGDRNYKLVSIDFEKSACEQKLYMDHNILVERAINMYLMLIEREQK